MAEIRPILDRLEMLGMIKQHKQTGNYMTITCPFHGDGNEKHASCGVLLIDEIRGGRKYPAGLFHCFTCHYSKDIAGAVKDLIKSHDVDAENIEWFKENVPGYGEMRHEDTDFLLPPESAEKLLNSLTVDYINLLRNPGSNKFISEQELVKYRYTVPYMYERRLTDELIEKFDVGFQGDWIPPGRKRAVPCITFPVRDRYGRTLFIVRRSIEGKLFNYPEGVVKPVYGIFELPGNCRSVIICESIFNALTAWRYGKPAVALLGTGNSYQIQQLKELGAREFVLCMDGDEAGQRATEKLYKQLRSTAIIWRMHMPDGKDINDCEEQEFLDLYADRD